ncbi:modular serine protease-like [Planococcus citri]|uniref:modular serine protease-like n=1 Tax=Planococcus citri TaxID=170843 RepID=UPI0031F935FF
MITRFGSVTCMSSIYFLINTIVLHSLSIESDPAIITQKYYDGCEQWEFQCKNGKCIANIFVCDGLKDCSDGSDETLNQCQNVTCDEQHFRCHYGACINNKYRLDGLKQCHDGSDELPEINDTSSDELVRRKRADEKSCAIPASLIDKTVTIHCAQNTTKSCNLMNGYAPEYSIASVKCTSGYYLEDEQDEDDDDIEHICHNKNWKPRIRECFKICDKLKPVNVDLHCYRNELSIPCNENTVLLSGTKVRPLCKPTHRYSNDYPPEYFEIKCNKDGQWNKPLFSCLRPACGQQYSNPQLAIANGTKERYSDSPWHVAIFNQHKILICGGTIITPYLILSAAHCFVDQQNYSEPLSADNYEVVVSKVTNNYSAVDNPFQKNYKIKEIVFSDKGYFGQIKYHDSDIAILIVTEKITTGPTTLPACINWTGLRSGHYPLENTPGKVSGWGRNENGTYSETLRTSYLPFISNKHCTDIVPDDDKRFIRFDKFCAGSETGPGVFQGEGGGGLLFKEFNQYYLQGIVSVKPNSLSSIALFTDIGLHTAWISAVSKKAEEELQNTRNFTSPISNQTTTISYSTSTSSNGSQITPKVDIVTTHVSQSTTPKVVQKKNATTIAAEYCTKYSQYRYVKKWKPSQTANAAGLWLYAMDCLNVVTSIAGGVKALPKEYPHMALVGIGAAFESVKWLGAGTLISERFILTTAHMSDEDSPKWVLLGDLNFNSSNEESMPAVYGIKNIYLHPNYTPPSLYNDIALYELNTSVAISSYVRPACLYTSTYIPVNTRGSITGWGRTDAIERVTVSTNLLKGTIAVMNDRICKEQPYPANMSLRLKDGFNSDSMICAGDILTGNDACQGDAGSPLQIPVPGQICMWNVIGITSFGPGICGNLKTPAVYTKVAFYIDWIQSIVWP